MSDIELLIAHYLDEHAPSIVQSFRRHTAQPLIPGTTTTTSTRMMADPHENFSATLFRKELLEGTFEPYSQPHPASVYLREW